MVRGLYTAASGALVAQSQADTIASNLANVNTNGFKQTLLQIQSAPTMDLYRFQTDPGTTPGKNVPGVSVQQYVGTLGTGSQIFDTPLQFEQGPLQQTGNATDMAIQGTSNAFFAIATPQGVRYTRDGQFAINANGLVQTQDGNNVLGTNGLPILVQQTQGPVAVGADGTITQAGQRIGQLQLTQFGNLNALRPQGDDLLMNTGNAQPAPVAPGAASVQQGFLEKSGTNVVRSMVDLITAERWFEANTKAITTQDEATGQAITTVSRSTPQ